MPKPTAHVLTWPSSRIAQPLLAVFRDLQFSLVVHEDPADFRHQAARQGAREVFVVDLVHLQTCPAVSLGEILKDVGMSVFVAVPAAPITGGVAHVAIVPLSRDANGGAGLGALESLALLDDIAKAPARAHPRLEALTRREMDVLRLVLQGLSLKEVGRELGISPKTAQVHRESILRKAGVDSVARLMRVMVDAGIPLGGIQAGGQRPRRGRA